MTLYYHFSQPMELSVVGREISGRYAPDTWSRPLVYLGIYFIFTLVVLFSLNIC